MINMGRNTEYIWEIHDSDALKVALKINAFYLSLLEWLFKEPKYQEKTARCRVCEILRQRVKFSLDILSKIPNAFFFAVHFICRNPKMTGEEPKPKNISRTLLLNSLRNFVHD